MHSILRTNTKQRTVKGGHKKEVHLKVKEEEEDQRTERGQKKRSDAKQRKKNMASLPLRTYDGLMKQENHVLLVQLASDDRIFNLNCTEALRLLARLENFNVPMPPAGRAGVTLSAKLSVVRGIVKRRQLSFTNLPGHDIPTSTVFNIFKVIGNISGFAPFLEAPAVSDHSDADDDNEDHGDNTTNDSIDGQVANRGIGTGAGDDSDTRDHEGPPPKRRRLGWWPLSAWWR